MTSQQIRWAQSHDWYKSASLIESSPLEGQFLVFVKETGTQLLETGEVIGYEKDLSFESFKELKDWAGY